MSTAEIVACVREAVDPESWDAPDALLALDGTRLDVVNTAENLDDVAGLLRRLREDDHCQGEVREQRRTKWSCARRVVVVTTRQAFVPDYDVEIASPPMVEALTPLRVWNVADLCEEPTAADYQAVNYPWQPVPPREERKESFGLLEPEGLVALVTSHVDPLSWGAYGVHAEVSLSTLFVSNTPANLDEVDRLLARLREALRPQTEARAKARCRPSASSATEPAR